MSLKRTVTFVGLTAFLFSCSGESEITTAKIEDSEAESSVSESDAKSSISKGGESSSSKKSSSSAKASSSSKKSDEKKSSSSTSDDDVLVVDSLEDLPNCTAKRGGMVAFVKAEKKIYACDDGRWSVEVETSSSSKKNSSSSNEEAKRSSSSSKVDVSSSSEKSSSSSSEEMSSSSSEKSSSSSAVSSSSLMGPGSEYGYCMPVKTPIERGERTAWKMVKSASLSAQVVLNADFDWTFADGTPATSAKHGNMSSDEITYASAGEKTARLTFTPMGSGSGVDIECAPLQVKGAAITECECSASQSGNVAVGSTVEWTVSGCQSDGANIVVYEWGGGVTGEGASATATFAEINEVIQPTLVVSNDDNTSLQVECPAVTAVESNSHRCLARLSGECLLSGVWKLNGATRITEIDGDTLYSIDPNHDFSADPATLQFKEDSTFTFTMSSLTKASCVEEKTYGTWSIANGMLELRTRVGNTCLFHPTWNGKVKFRIDGDRLEMDLQGLFFLNSEMELEDVYTQSISREVFETRVQ